jgi:uracil-DNA glycosylase
VLAIQNFQQRLYARYKHSLALPPTYHYLYGNPVQPLVPLDTAQGGVCIIGAYPTARFAAFNLEGEVPFADICQPFSAGRYFDGRQVRVVASGAELEEAYLAPLGLRREQCWITNLVKIFLFQDEHLAGYRRLDCPWPEWETRSRFEKLARQSLAWLEEELVLARPRLVITLGAEVAGVLQDVRGQAATHALLGGHLKDLWLGETVYPALHLAHPGVVICPASDHNPWPRLHREEHLPAARKVAERLVGN